MSKRSGLKEFIHDLRRVVGGRHDVASMTSEPGDRGYLVEMTLRMMMMENARSGVSL